MACAIKQTDGSACLKTPTHHWGAVEFCCDHFDQFVSGLFETRGAISEERKHLEIVEEYNRRTKRTSVIPGAPCDSEKKK
jgi:hypothetical protein